MQPTRVGVAGASGLPITGLEAITRYRITGEVMQLILISVAHTSRSVIVIGCCMPGAGRAIAGASALTMH